MESKATLRYLSHDKTSIATEGDSFMLAPVHPYAVGHWISPRGPQP